MGFMMNGQDYHHVDPMVEFQASALARKASKRSNRNPDS